MKKYKILFKEVGGILWRIIVLVIIPITIFLYFKIPTSIFAIYAMGLFSVYTFRTWLSERKTIKENYNKMTDAEKKKFKLGLIIPSLIIITIIIFLLVIFIQTIVDDLNL